MLALFIFDSLQQKSAKTRDKTVLKPLETCCLQLLLLEITGTTAFFPAQLTCLTALLREALEGDPHLPLSDRQCPCRGHCTLRQDNCV